MHRHEQDIQTQVQLLGIANSIGRRVAYFEEPPRELGAASAPADHTIVPVRSSAPSTCRRMPDGFVYDRCGRRVGIAQAKVRHTDRSWRSVEMTWQIAWFAHRSKSSTSQRCRPVRSLMRGRARRVRRSRQSRRICRSGRDGPPSGESDPPGLAQARREQYPGALEGPSSRRDRNAS